MPYTPNKLQRYVMSYDESNFDEPLQETPDDHGDWCKAADVVALEAERDALKKRVEELTRLARLGKAAVEALARCEGGAISDTGAWVGLAIRATHLGLIESGNLTGAAKVAV